MSVPSFSKPPPANKPAAFFHVKSDPRARPTDLTIKKTAGFVGKTLLNDRLLSADYRNRMAGSPKSVQVRRTSASVVVTLAARAASPSVAGCAPKSCR